MAHRCRVCNRTDDFRLTIRSEDYFPGPYRRDTRSEHPLDFLCMECDNIIWNSLLEFDLSVTDNIQLPEEDYVDPTTFIRISVD